MITNLLQAGFPLTVWNRTLAKAEPLRALGATVAGSAADVAAASDVIITMVADDAALEELLFGDHGVTTALRPGTVVVDMSAQARSAWNEP